MTNLDNRAIIVNCIIIAYYAFLCPRGVNTVSKALKIFDIIFIRVYGRERTKKHRFRVPRRYSERIIL